MYSNCCYCNNTVDKASKGIQTPQYKCVQENYPRLTDHLRINAQTKVQLFGLFIAKGWCDAGNCPSENVLINIVLNRIKDKSTEYGVFISMLEQIPSMENIVKDLKGAF